ncbi:MAG: restriction endonuclease [Chloroflexi bacterium HGW-Chloroflexi-6]|nr:MAG: restriction endonuclease [Chloroflexi bacterium HGW-Chloroflexi-6]
MMWNTVKFGDVVRQVKDKVEPQTAGLERFVAGEHMDTDNLHIRRWGDVGDGYLGPAFHMRFKPGQVLYGSRRTYLRKVAVAEFEGITANTTYVIESKDPEVLLPELLPFIMQMDSFNEHSIKQSKGSVNPYINFSDITWYEFRLPPVDEQRRIANLLWAADDAITEWQQTISKLEKLLAAVREDVLCSKNLPRKKLKTCVKNITAGKSVLGIGKPAAENEIGVLKVSAVGADGFVADENKVLEDNDTFIPAFSVRANDLLITRANTRELVGRVCKAPKEYPNLMLSDKTLRLEVDEVFGDKDFLLQVLRSKEARKQIEATASGTGGAMKNISQVQILNLNLPLPELNIQKELAAKTNEAEKTLEQTRIHLGNSFELKKQLLKKMLSA